MPNEKIQFSLKERFAAPLPEFYCRRIVFWQDPDREFEKDVDELELPGVRVIRLTGTNNFAVKKLLLHDDLQSDFLIYCPLAYADEQEDWLQDIEYYSEIFQADFISLQMEELNIASSAAMRRAVKLYARFLESKERRLKLRRIGHEYQSPGQLHIDVMTVLAGVARRRILSSQCFPPGWKRKRIPSYRMSAASAALAPSGSWCAALPGTSKRRKSRCRTSLRTYCLLRFHKP